ncbi:ParB N-terminal domain-containing protein [Paraburkholderia sp. RL18-085-BIA-A]|uniref:ParB N-terminal domain-containing protein n=1 Tax=Paraburkholderia sp. RL18-085-BIA-A TaxID=3031633 RepID=UPI0038B7B70B
MITELQLHPLCTLFPRIVGAEFEALKADIAENGLRQPIVIHNGMILDGGNRYRACVEIGVEPTTVEFDGGSIVSYVLSANLHRRHLSTGQQAAIVASAQDWAKAQPHGGDRKSNQSATLHLDTAEKRAAESGASLRTQKMADKVAKASPELAKKVAHGEVSLPKAVEQLSPKASDPEPATPANEGDADDFGPSAAELAFLEEKEQSDREAYDALVEVAFSDDKLGEALKLVAQQAEEIGCLKAEVRTLKEARDSHMNAKNEAIRMVKSLQKKLAKLEKEAA